MPTAQTLYERWINELWAGRPVAARWVGTRDGDGDPAGFTGNDILRLAGDGQRFAEYWTGTSAG